MPTGSSSTPSPSSGIESAEIVGSFYTNITLRGTTQDQVAAFLAGRGRRAMVTPTSRELTVVYDADGEAQDGSIYELARALSDALGCVALAVMNHDDSVLYFQLFREGVRVDEYDSCPSYFEHRDPLPPAGGDAPRLCELFAAPGMADRVEDILRFDSIANEDEDRYVFEMERHADLVQALGLSDHAVGTGYDAIASGQVPRGLDLRDCVAVEA